MTSILDSLKPTAKQLSDAAFSRMNPYMVYTRSEAYGNRARYATLAQARSAAQTRSLETLDTVYVSHQDGCGEGFYVDGYSPSYT